MSLPHAQHHRDDQARADARRPVALQLAEAAGELRTRTRGNRHTMTTPASRSRPLSLDELCAALSDPDPEIRGAAANLITPNIVDRTAAAIMAQDPAAKAEFDRPRSGWPDRGPTPAATLAAYLRAQTPREFRR